LASGVDEYVMKPFTSSELLVRVRSQITLAETRRKDAERHSHWRTMVETVLDQMPIGILVVELPSEAIILCSQTLQTMLGRALSKATRLEDIPVAFAFHPDGTPYSRDQYPLVRTVSTGEIIVGEEFAYEHSNGHRVNLRANSRLVRDPDGRPMAAVLLLEDRAEPRRVRTGT